MLTRRNVLKLTVGAAVAPKAVVTTITEAAPAPVNVIAMQAYYDDYMTTMRAAVARSFGVSIENLIREQALAHGLIHSDFRHTTEDTTMTNRVDCLQCHQGVCPRCSGGGGTSDGRSCPNCGGTGKCPACKGEGDIEQPQTEAIPTS